MSRLLDIDADKRTPDQNNAFERLAAGRGRIPTPYKVWIHSPTLALGMESVGTFLNKKSSLNRAQIEICIVQIAKHWEGDYALNNHIKAAKKAGMDDATIEKLNERTEGDLRRSEGSGGLRSDLEPDRKKGFVRR